MHIHILGICGTFMGGIAALAKAAGHRVSGSDLHVYPPMSEQLAALGIDLIEGYQPEQLQPAPDLVIIGNALSRGNAAVEYVLNHKLAYVSGPQWLGQQFLQHRQVVAVAGTHGKTTTTAMLAWILHQAGLEPGYLIGGVALDFDVSACAGRGPFVLEADEYDSAFFDKRAKFVHYHPDVLIINNLEHDHADIYANLAAIQTQFHHLLRTVPSQGSIIHNAADANVQAVLKMGCWSQCQGFGLQAADWQVKLVSASGSQLEFLHKATVTAELHWQHGGTHNALNACAALAAAAALGVTPAQSVAALTSFRGVRRRLEVLHHTATLSVYDDFAHHPTAIATTLRGLRAKIGAAAQLLVALELRSNTMRRGEHKQQLAAALAAADAVAICIPANLNWDIAEVVDALQVPACAFVDTDAMLGWLQQQQNQQAVSQHIVFMSNGGFDNAPGNYVKRYARLA
ncbi:MAG: UDP-N-acetylmuramate:L-alanyl-gamma-D-glutamyl-meso-diaminopimelate ligase [Gammaproteobacteria bacterium]|jgi:UDP-N-acetylmuramate: L-alanyl-gamma-D-glutamyl-meso-diaminopimelate ligase|nr:UDP-N-acetylmuramate:L-alanyl-gamma-D-glutamyl-meso-diaminopimelate ligase [Gammaproteobacteria bacterium]